MPNLNKNRKDMSSRHELNRIIAGVAIPGHVRQRLTALVTSLENGKSDLRAHLAARTELLNELEDEVTDFRNKAPRPDFKGPAFTHHVLKPIADTPVHGSQVSRLNKEIDWYKQQLSELEELVTKYADCVTRRNNEIAMLKQGKSPHDEEVAFYRHRISERENEVVKLKHHIAELEEGASKLQLPRGGDEDDSVVRLLGVGSALFKKQADEIKELQHKVKHDENEHERAKKRFALELTEKFTAVANEQLAAFEANKRKGDEAVEPASKKTKLAVSEEYKGASARLLVGNLSWTVSERQLVREFEKFGEVKSARVFTDEQGRSKCYGYVQFTTAEAGAKALEALSGYIVEGRALHVRFHYHVETPQLNQ